MGQSGCSKSSTVWDLCFLNDRNGVGISDASGTLDTIIEESDDLDDEVEVDVELEDQSIAVTTGESEVQTDDQVVSMEVGGTRPVTQFVEDSIDLNIVSIYGNTPFHSMSLMEVFLDVRAAKDEVIRSGIAIFQHIYHAPGTTLGAIRYNMFSRKAAAGMIKPETLPPTEGAAAQHSLRAYLQTRDWLLLQSMSVDPNEYGWTVGVHGSSNTRAYGP